MMTMYRSKHVGVTQVTNDYFFPSFLDQLQYNYFDTECTVHFVHFIICVQQMKNIFCTYRASFIYFLFAPTMYNIYVYYFKNIYIIITGTCFDIRVFVSSSTT